MSSKLLLNDANSNTENKSCLRFLKKQFLFPKQMRNVAADLHKDLVSV